MATLSWKDTSTWRFFCYLLSGLIVITLISALVYFLSASHFAKKYLDQSLKTIFTTHVPELVEDLWVTDFGAVRKTAEGIASFNYIARVEVRENSKPIVAVGIDAGPGMETIHRELRYDYKGEIVPIGRLSLVVDKEKLFWGPFQSAGLLFLFQALLSLFFSIIAATIFHTAYGRNVQKLIRFIQSDDPKKFGSPFVLGRKSNRRDELQLLTDHLNALRKKIDDAMVEIRESNNELSAANRRLSENQRELQWNKEQLELALSVAAIGVWDWNFKTGELTFVPEYYTMLGYDPGEFPPTFEAWKRLIHPDDMESALRVVHAYLETKADIYENSFRMRTKAGPYRFISARGKVVERDGQGEAVRLIGNHMDITDRIKASKTLRKIERRNQALLDHSPVCHKIVNLDFTLQYMSANGFKMLKLEPAAKVYGKPYPFHFFPEAFRSQMIENLKKVKASKETLTMEARTNDVEGNEVWLDSSLIPVLDDDGRIDYITVVSADTTQRKRDEKEKKRLGEKLIQAQKMEAIGTIAGGIAHDFNNLLTPIIGMSELLLEDLPTESLEHENALEILNAGKRGAELVKQILAFSRQTEHKLSPIRIQHIIKEVLKLSRSTIPSYIEIDQEIQPDCGFIMADPIQMHQIAMNIITNAYHAVETDGGNIRVALREAELGASDLPGIDLAPGGYAILTVSDTGNGISPELMDKIFDPYFTTKEQGKGTGLGLAVVYGIVREHKGEVKVYSEIGKGTTFHVYLPLMRKTAGSDRKDAIENDPTGHERVMLVDDDPSIARLGQQMLERLGYSVTKHTASLEALAAFRSSPDAFDLIVSDMNMPNMTGVQLAGEIKSIRTDIPFIICTGFSEKIDAGNTDSLGIEAVLMKPIIKSEMAKGVRNVLDGAKRRGPGPP